MLKLILREELSLKCIIDIEDKILNLLRNEKYVPKKLHSGKFECFNINPLNIYNELTKS